MKILLIVLLVLLVLLLIPIRAVTVYDQEGFRAWLKVLFLRFRLYPKKKEEQEKEPAEETPEEKKSKGKKPSKEQEPSEPKEDDKAEDEPEEKKGGKLEQIQAALPLVKPALAGIKKRLTIDDLELFVTWRSDNPADAAIGYGRASAALGTLWTLVDTNFKVKKSRLGCRADFTEGKSEVYLNATVSLNLWKALTLVLPILIKFLCNYTRLKKARDDKMKKEA